MCGICGSVDLSRSSSPEELERVATAMAATLGHRGPDDRGTWVDPAVGLALGHTRLAVIDLSPEGHQPMASRSGRHVIVYNGEIYNHAELRLRLESTGVVFRGHSDTEVLLEAIDSWGLKAALEQANGMFALAVHDREERTLAVARDRLGEKPLYHGRVRGHHVFASELKALRAHPMFDARLDRDALTLLLRHGYIPAPYSVYEGIAKLPPASIATFDLEDQGTGPVIEPYWSALEAARAGTMQPLRRTDQELVDEVELLLGDAVGRRMVADVPLGAFLSGGVDSSVVVALMQQRAERPVRTFTIGFDEKGYDEAHHARAVADHLGTDHTELRVTPSEAREVIPTLPTLYDEPFADSSQIPTTLVADLARRDVTVALSGDGGDELFGGYTRYLLHRSVWKRIGWLPEAARHAVGQGLRAVPAERWDRVLTPMQPVLPAVLRQDRPGGKVHKLAGVLTDATAGSTYLSIISHWPEPAEIVLGASEPDTPLTAPAERIGLDDVTDRVMYLDAVSYLPDDILAKVDRASMSRSLEVRVPMLDHRLYELAWRLPRRARIRNGRGKWALRQVLHRHVPRELVERPKMGFGVPVGAWLRGPLREWAEDLLDAGVLREQGLLAVAPVRERWEQHLAGTHDWQYLLWDVLVLQAWLADTHPEKVP